MAYPVYQNYGDESNGAGNVTYPWPAGVQVNDLGLLFIETTGEPVIPPSGWTVITGSNGIPADVSVGTSGASDATRMIVMMRRYQSGDSNPTVTDPGDHQVGHTAIFRAPNGVSIGHVQTSSLETSSNDITCPAIACNGSERTFVFVASSPLDTDTWPGSVTWTNSNLTNFAEGNTIFIGSQTSVGNGGAFAGISARCNTVTSSIGTTTSTWSPAAAKSARISIELYESAVVTNLNIPPSYVTGTAVTPTLSAGPISLSIPPAYVTGTVTDGLLELAAFRLPPAYITGTAVTPVLTAGNVSLPVPPSYVTGVAIDPALSNLTLEIGVHGSGVILYGASGDGSGTFTVNSTDRSSMFVSFGGGNMLDMTQARAPTDNKGNLFRMLSPRDGTNLSAFGDPGAREYHDFEDYGVAIWATSGSASGGLGHTFYKSRQANDEVSFCVIEVKGGKTITDVRWNHPDNGQTLLAQTVSSSRPHVVLASWWGDSPTGANHSVVVNDGFTLLGGYGIDHPNGYVQFFYAAKVNPTGGLTNLTWTETPDQGAQLPILLVEGDYSVSAASSTGSAITPSLSAAPLSLSFPPSYVTGTAVTPSLSSLIPFPPSYVTGVAVDPTLSPGSVSISIPASYVTGTAVDPVLNSIFSLSIPPVHLTGTVTDPTFTAGAATVTTSPPYVTGTATVPELVAGPISLSIPSAYITGTVTEGQFFTTLSAITIPSAYITGTVTTPIFSAVNLLSIPSAGLSGSVLDPSFTLSGISLAFPAVSVTGTVTVPALSAGTLIDFPAAITSGSVVDPTLSAGSISMSVPAVHITGTAIDPTIFAGIVFLSAPGASVSSSLPDPTLLSGLVVSMPPAQVTGSSPGMTLVASGAVLISFPPVSMTGTVTVPDWRGGSLGSSGRRLTQVGQDLNVGPEQRPFNVRTVTEETVDMAVVGWISKRVAPRVLGPTDSLVDVPVIFSAGERFIVSADADELRDEDGRVIFPVIRVMRDDLELGSQPTALGIDVPSMRFAQRISRKTTGLANADRRRPISSRRLRGSAVYDVYTIPYPIQVEMRYTVEIITNFRQHVNDIQQKILDSLDNKGIPSFRMNLSSDYSPGFIRDGQGPSERSERLQSSFDDRPPQDDYYLVGFLEGSMSDEGTDQDSTDQERTFESSFSIRVPVALMLEPEGRRSSAKRSRTAFGVSFGDESVRIIDDPDERDEIFGSDD